MYLVLKITHPRSDGLNQGTSDKLFITQDDLGHFAPNL